MLRRVPHTIAITTRDVGLAPRDAVRLTPGDPGVPALRPHVEAGRAAVDDRLTGAEAPVVGLVGPAEPGLPDQEVERSRVHILEPGATHRIGARIRHRGRAGCVGIGRDTTVGARHSGVGVDDRGATVGDHHAAVRRLALLGRRVARGSHVARAVAIAGATSTGVLVVTDDRRAAVRTVAGPAIGRDADSGRRRADQTHVAGAVAVARSVDGAHSLEPAAASHQACDDGEDCHEKPHGQVGDGRHPLVVVHISSCASIGHTIVPFHETRGLGCENDLKELFYPINQESAVAKALARQEILS